MNKGHKIILKPKIPIISWVIAERHSIIEGNARMNSIIQWKWLAQDHAMKVMQIISQHTHEHVHSFPLDLTLELHEELSDSIATWTVPCKQLLTDKHRAA